MSRVLVDANVLISAFVFRASTPAEAVGLVLAAHRLVLTQWVLDELHDVVERKWPARHPALETFLGEIDYELAEPGAPSVSISDPDDQPILDDHLGEQPDQGYTSLAANEHDRRASRDRDVTVGVSVRAMSKHVRQRQVDECIEVLTVGWVDGAGRFCNDRGRRQVRIGLPGEVVADQERRLNDAEGIAKHRNSDTRRLIHMTACVARPVVGRRLRRLRQAEAA